MTTIKRTYWIALSCLSIASGILNMVQARRISQFGTQLDEANSRNLGRLAVGSAIPPLSLRDSAGAVVTVEFEGVRGGTLLYVFSPSCGWCISNAKAETQLAKTLKGKYRVVGVSLSSEGLLDFVKRYQPEFDLYGAASTETAERLGLGTTPQLIVVGTDRRVKKVWTGAFSGRTKEGIEEYFATKLPTAVAGD